MHSPMLRERRCDISGADRRMIRDITWQNNTEISRQKRKNSYPMGNYASDFIWNIASLADLGAEGHAEMMGTLSENAGKMLKVRSECVGLSAGRWDATTKKVCVSDRREGPICISLSGEKIRVQKCLPAGKCVSLQVVRENEGYGRVSFRPGIQY